MDLPLTIKDTQEKLLKKEVSAVTLVDAYLQRINTFNPQLNAVLTVSDDFAYKKAREIDDAIGSMGSDFINTHPLAGVVVLHKDLFLTEGIRTTAASNVLKDFMPRYSASVVKRLEDAGCICIGKTNCDAWAHGASGENSDFGPTKNPWNTEYVPGGSSSGSAVGVAANLALIATGTDTGGSIRQPANFCGVVGFKPTYGAVPRYGVVAMASSLDSMGHFTRSAEDAEKVFEVTKGTDNHDSTVRNEHKNNFDSGKKFKIGIPREYFVKGIDPEVEKKVLEASRVFEKAGCELAEISLPHTKYAISVYYIVQPAEVSSNLGRYDGIRYGYDRDSFGDEAKRRIMLGTYVLSAGYYDAYYLKAMKVRSKIIQDFENAFNTVDAVIAPVSPTPAFKLGEKATDPLKMYLADIFTVAANLAGIPGLSMPFGYSAKGLPLGFQLMGPRFSESVLFTLGKVFERETDWKPVIAKL